MQCRTVHCIPQTYLQESKEETGVEISEKLGELFIAYPALNRDFIIVVVTTTKVPSNICCKQLEVCATTDVCLSGTWNDVYDTRRCGLTLKCRLSWKVYTV
jgi:hypothetical protein